MKSSSTLIRLVFVGMGLLCLTTSVLLSPSFVETHLSPDHVLEQATIARLQLAQGLVALLGILCLLVSLFARPLGRSTCRLWGYLDQLNARMLQKAPGWFGRLGWLSADALRCPLDCLGQLSLARLRRLWGWLSHLGRFVFRQGDPLRRPSLVVLRNLPLLTLVIIMCFVRVDNLMWMKTGGASNCYGLKTVFLSDEEKLVSWGWVGHHASVFYINNNTPEGSLVLVTEDAPYFYRAKRPGIYWRDPRMGPFYEADSIEDAYEFLLSMGIDYLQISERTMRQTLFQKSHFEEILSKPEMCRLIWDYRGGGPTQVFKLERPE